MKNNTPAIAQSNAIRDPLTHRLQNPMQDTLKLTFVSIPYTLLFLFLTVFFTSCSNDLSPKILTQTVEKTNSTHTISQFLNNNSNEDKIDSTEKIILLLTADANASSIVTQELGGTLLDTLEINGKLYARATGINKNINTLQTHAKIVSVEIDQTRTIFVAPNDSFYDFQYAPHITELESVWDDGFDGTGVTVAVIDTGINTLHEDFGGESTFVEGYDYVDGSSYSTTGHSDKHGHGTHVAGIIGARKNNRKGISGVAPQVTLMPIRVGTETFFSFDLAVAIKFATDNNADIINMSLGGPSTSGIEGESIKYALDKKVTLVAAAGNDGIQVKTYPASYPGVIAVGSSNGRDEISYFSTHNSLLSVVAPGEEILSLNAGDINKPSKSYVINSGTSMASPFVAGVAALLKHKFPLASPVQIKSILETTATDIDVAGFDNKSGYGRVNPKNALATQTLPAVTWTEVEYTITFNSTPLNNYLINILDSTGTNTLYTILTQAEGKAALYLKAGDYQISSAYLGIPYKDNLIVANTTISKTKQFSSADFDNGNYYRVSTYFTSASVDTELQLYRNENNGSPIFVSKNDNKTTGNLYSEIIFKAIPKMLYVFQVSISSSEGDKSPGEYRIILEKGYPSTYPTSTNDKIDTSDVLEAGGDPRHGYLQDKEDRHFFLFIAP